MTSFPVGDIGEKSRIFLEEHRDLITDDRLIMQKVEISKVFVCEVMFCDSENEKVNLGDCGFMVKISMFILKGKKN